MTNQPWNVLHVSANHEKKVAQHLAVRCLENYLPLYKERSRWTDRAVTLERPLFPGYVFVRFTPASRLSVISTPGTLRLLSGFGVETVDSAEIDRIRQSLDSGCVLRPHPRINTGTRVLVCRGIFEGTEGIVTELRRDCRVILSLAGVRQYFSLDIDLRDIEVLGEVGRCPDAESSAYSCQLQ
ncbi:MAG: transcription termination/antitermination NusG family protein [Terracidiphilus sp.]|jgi:transcription antitermination factor NusG